MNKLLNEIITKKAAQIAQAADEQITISKKVFGLEIGVALLGGIVFGMLFSPRKTVTYKIASNNHDIGDCSGCSNCDGDEEDYDEDDFDEDDGKCCRKRGKLIKL